MTPGEEAAVAYRVAQLEQDVKRLEQKVDRVTWALVTLALSLAGSAVVFALTVASLQ